MACPRSCLLATMNTQTWCPKRMHARWENMHAQWIGCTFLLSVCTKDFGGWSIMYQPWWADICLSCFCDAAVAMAGGASGKQQTHYVCDSLCQLVCAHAMTVYVSLCVNILWGLMSAYVCACIEIRSPLVCTRMLWQSMSACVCACCDSQW